MNSPILLDVNVLVALLWPQHTAHASAQAWFSKHAKEGWATCPFTEAAFVRLVSNPAFSQSAVTPQEAIGLLSENLKHPSHVFWPDAIGITEATARFHGRLHGHRQVTDAYLLGLVYHYQGRLATLDRAIRDLPSGSRLDAARILTIGGSSNA